MQKRQAASVKRDPKLTANVYTDPRLLDAYSALDALPRLPLDSTPLDNSTDDAGDHHGRLPIQDFRAFHGGSNGGSRR